MILYSVQCYALHWTDNYVRARLPLTAIDLRLFERKFKLGLNHNKYSYNYAAASRVRKVGVAESFNFLTDIISFRQNFDRQLQISDRKNVMGAKNFNFGRKFLQIRS